MEKKRYLITLHEEVVENISIVQKNLVGSSNLSGLVEKLLIQWLQSFMQPSEEEQSE